MPEIETTLKGLAYRMTPVAIRELNGLCPVRVEVRRDWENEADENAISVYCLEPPWEDAHIGYIDRQMAKELAPRLDSGKLEFHDGWLIEADVDGTGPLVLNFRKVKPPK